MTDLQLYLLVPLAPLAGADRRRPRRQENRRSGRIVVRSRAWRFPFIASCVVFLDVLDGAVFNGPVYTWLVVDGTAFRRSDS